MAIHSLKGVSRNLGAKALSQICKKIEESFNLGIKSSDVKSLETILSKTKDKLVALIEKKRIELSSIKNIKECKEELLILKKLLSEAYVVVESLIEDISTL